MQTKHASNYSLKIKLTSVTLNPTVYIFFHTAKIKSSKAIDI